ncbi:MAG: DUF333 domain-containing protein [archaeon]
MRSKAQANQMFNYIMVLIVMAVILSMGFYFIGKIPKETGKAQFEHFKNEILNDIEMEARNDDGINHQYAIGSGFEKICFLNLNPSGTRRNCLSGVPPEVRAEVTTGTKSNVFLVGPKDFRALEADASLRVKDSTDCAGCFDITDGRVYLFFEGYNRYLVIGGELVEEQTSVSAVSPVYSYCETLGYTSNDTHCIFLSSASCELWAFYRGECGSQFSYCKRKGYTLKTVNDNMGAWTAVYSVCVFDDGSECLEEDYLNGACQRSQCNKYLMSQGGCLT